MPLGFSLYLDIVRIIAALAVLLNHLGFGLLTGDVLPPRLTQYGDIAVTVFFVLSGYLIAYVLNRGEGTWRSFAVMRSSRLWSVVVLALMLTAALDWVGSKADPELYASPSVLQRPPSLQSYLSSLLFLNEYFVLGELRGAVPGTNGPFWSLSFEATYYLLAGLLVFLPRRWSIPAGLLLMFCAGPTIVALLPVWALGFIVQRTLPKLGLSRPVAILCFLASGAFILVWPDIAPYVNGDNGGLTFTWGRHQTNRALLRDYLPALVFAINLVAAQALFRSAGVGKRAIQIVRWASEITFPLYCIHFPLLCCLRALSPWTANDPANVALLLAGTIAVTVAATPLTSWLRELGRLRLGARAARPTAPASG